MPSSSPVDEAIRRMYEAPPDGFVAARTAAVAAAKKAGDTAAVKRLTALRKPTVAAWLVNLLALRKPELLAELAELADALRTAQRTLKGAALRELSDQRRRIVSALVAEARRLAVAEDRSLAAKLPLGEVEATLTAALAEPEVAEQVRSGRLVRAVSYAGFGEVPRPRLRLVTGDSAVPDEVAGPEPERPAVDREVLARLRELKRELTAARAAEKRADDQLEKAESAERDAGHTVEDLDNELAELERRRAEAQAEVARRKVARRAAEREAAAARRRVGDAEAAIEDLESSKTD